MRLTLKLLLISELVLLITVAVLLFPVWNAMRLQVVDNMQNELLAIASTAAVQVDGDLHHQIRTMDDQDSPIFHEIRRQLTQVQRANHIPINHLYTFYRDGDVMRFAVMLNPLDEIFIGNSYPIQPLMRPVLDEAKMTSTALYEDANGRWISAYAPIRNSAGDVVGLLAVDKDSTEYFMTFNSYTRQTLMIGLGSLLLASLLGWFVLNRTVIRPMGRVHHGMVALANNDFEHKVNLKTGDEFQELGETLNSMAKELNAAKRVQAGFFPRTLPETEHYRLAAISDPCDATGGDYFDAIDLGDGRIAVLVADVSGHGLGPSLLMASCRAAIHALSRDERSPANILRRLDELLQDDLADGRFITMIFGILEPDGTFTYANAGHGPAILVSDDGVTNLASHRPPLGVWIDLGDEEQETSITLYDTDRVFLASDGLTESMNEAGEQFGNARMEKIVANPGATCREIVMKLREAVSGFSARTRRTDDITMLCVDRV